MVHDHVWGELNHWKKMPNVELVAAGDPNAPLREKAQAQGVQRVYDSWQQMLDKEELDIVQAAAENSAGAEIVEACAAQGIHVISEKPMAARLSQADRMLRAAKQRGVELLVNWPTAWNPSIVAMTDAIKSGRVGDLFYWKFRSAHNGPKEIGCSEYFWGWLYDEEKNGAGALMDYCCYSADMASYLLGKPKSVVGIRSVLVKDYPLPDDNAIILMQYEHAFGVAEASWTQRVGYATPNPVAYGTEGSIVIWRGEVYIQRPNSSEHEKVEAPPLPEGRRNGPEYLIHCLETGQTVEGMCSAIVSRNAQEILEAGYRSANTGQRQDLPLKD